MGRGSEDDDFAEFDVTEAELDEMLVRGEPVELVEGPLLGRVPVRRKNRLVVSDSRIEQLLGVPVGRP
jgi:hypothetical protein